MRDKLSICYMPVNSKSVASMGLTSLLKILLLSVWLVACSPPPKVAVVERTLINENSESEALGGRHIRIVAPGDTLHAIAFGNGIDANKLAMWTRISDTSKLQVGQRVRLTEPIGFKPPKPKLANSKAVSSKVLKSKLIRAEPLQPSVPLAQQKNSPPEAKRASEGATQSAKPSWSWPTKGTVTSNFSIGSGQQGIDISGTLGQAVVAAGAGEVVYVGDGLKGYGNLVIIKHSERYLSAYAHNLETFVQEGQKVPPRFRIALLGKDKKQRDSLHFQIREFGKPVNPLRFLPSI